jgi:hypothetical protein
MSALLVLTAVELLPRAGPTSASEVNGTVSKVKPLWVADLKPLGFRKFRRGFVNDYGSMSSIAFSKDRVAVEFDTFNRERASTPNAAVLPNPQPFRLIVVFLDADTGKQSAIRSWPAAALDPDVVYSTYGGRFLVHLHEVKQGEGVGPSTLILLSQTFEELKRLQLALAGRLRHEWWEVETSPDGRVLLLCHVQEGVEEDQLLNPDTFERQAVWKDVHTGGASSVASHEMIRKRGLASDTPDMVSVRTPEQTWHALRSFEGHPKLLTENLIVATGGRKEHSGGVEVSRTTGEVVFSEDLRIGGRRTRIDAPIVSAGGKRFAAIVNSCIGNRCYGYRRFVFVWEPSNQDPVLGLQISANAPLFAAAALSPDGSLLAVVNGTTLEVYQVRNRAGAER